MNFLWYSNTLFIAFFLILGLMTSIINFFTVRRLDQYPSAKKLPFVSILVPARNEAHNIEACVRSLLAQDYPDYEIIVLDDHSTDDTPRILARLAQTDKRLQVLRSTPLPEGWLGKNWACHQLEQVSTGELILFTDADTVHAPDALRAGTSALIAESADLVTAFPCEQVVTWGERLLLPVLGFGIFTFFPIRLVQKLHLPAFSITLGQFMLFRHAAYNEMGGHEAVKSDTIDDICLGRLIQMNGGEWRLLDGTRHVSCRMYRGFWEAIDGFGRSAFAVFDYRILPYILGWLLADFAFLEPVVVVATIWMRPPLTYLPLQYAAVAVVFSILLWMIANHRFRFPAYLAFLYPLSLALFIAVFARSIFRTATWKGRRFNRSPVHWF